MESPESHSPDVVDIFGVMGPDGVTGVKTRGEELWTLQFTLAAWKYPDQTLQEKALKVSKKVQDEIIGITQERFHPYDVVHIKGRITENGAQLVELVGPYSPAHDLNEYARKLQEPVIFKDSTFGSLKLNQRYGWYEANIDWMGHSINLTIPAKNTEPGKEALAAAHSLWKAQAEWQQRMTNYILEELLELKNTAWLGEDEKELAGEDFANALELETISLDAEGGFEFWYNDGNLFWGHSIFVVGNLQDGPTRADLAG